MSRRTQGIDSGSQNLCKSVFICGCLMPRLTGDEFYFKAMEMRPGLSDRFIFITGFAADPKINDFLNENEVKYLVKPFPVQGLINCVKELLS